MATIERFGKQFEVATAERQVIAADLLLYRIFTEDIGGIIEANRKRLVKVCGLAKENVMEYLSNEADSYKALDAVLDYFSYARERDVHPPFKLDEFLSWCSKDIEHREGRANYYQKTIEDSITHFDANPSKKTTDECVEKIVERGVLRAQEHAAAEYTKITQAGYGARVSDKANGLKAGPKDAVAEQQRLLAKIAAVYENDEWKSDDDAVSAADVLNDVWDSLDFPEASLYGKLGEYARQLLLAS
jgi:hypothetical protein